MLGFNNFSQNVIFMTIQLLQNARNWPKKHLHFALSWGSISRSACPRRLRDFSVARPPEIAFHTILDTPLLGTPLYRCSAWLTWLTRRFLNL